MAKIRVLIADDHAVVRQGLRLLIQEDPRMEVAGEARTGREAVQITRQEQPDVVLMDVGMPVMSGLEATRQIASTQPQTRVLVLSSYSGDECVGELLKAGAVGYLTKQTASHELLQAIQEVHQGGSYFSPEVARRLRNRIKKTGAATGLPRQVRLSERERQVLQLVARGLPNKQIADVLTISIKTVEKHRQQMIDKLDIHDTAGLTRYAVDSGLVGASELSSQSPGMVAPGASVPANAAH